MHDLLYENQNHLKLHQLRGYAERLELDIGRAMTRTSRTSGTLQRVREHIEGGKLERRAALRPRSSSHRKLPQTFRSACSVWPRASQRL
jgi:hypothetical protein